MGSFTLTNNADIPAITFEIVQDTVSETAGYYATQGIVRRTTSDEVLNVTLASNNPNALYLPEGVSLAAGQTEKSFDIGILDNSQNEGFRTIEITASVLMATCNCAPPEASAGVQTESLVIIDNDGPSLSLLASPLSLPEGVSDAGTLTIRLSLIHI